MKCIGCDIEVGDSPAVYAILNETDFDALGVEPALSGRGKFHAAAVCDDCHRDPAHRTRPLKAHYALAPQIGRMLGLASSSGTIGG